MMVFTVYNGVCSWSGCDACPNFPQFFFRVLGQKPVERQPSKKVLWPNHLPRYSPMPLEGTAPAKLARWGTWPRKSLHEPEANPPLSPSSRFSNFTPTFFSYFSLFAASPSPTPHFLFKRGKGKGVEGGATKSDFGGASASRSCAPGFGRPRQSGTAVLLLPSFARLLPAPPCFQLRLVFFWEAPSPI